MRILRGDKNKRIGSRKQWSRNREVRIVSWNRELYGKSRKRRLLIDIPVSTAEYFFDTPQSPDDRRHKTMEDIRPSIQVKYPSKTKLCFGKNLKYCSSLGAIYLTKFPQLIDCFQKAYVSNLTGCLHFPIICTRLSNKTIEKLEN